MHVALSQPPLKTHSRCAGLRLIHTPWETYCTSCSGMSRSCRESITEIRKINTVSNLKWPVQVNVLSTLAAEPDVTHGKNWEVAEKGKVGMDRCSREMCTVEQQDKDNCNISFFQRLSSPPFLISKQGQANHDIMPNMPYCLSQPQVLSMRSKVGKCQMNNDLRCNARAPIEELCCTWIHDHH